MLAFIAALIFGFDLLFDPKTSVNLVELGLLFMALHLAFGSVIVGLWSQRTRQ
jgi:hypothetical protein